MKLFKDLIEELKEENLIEQTVIETSRAEADLAEAKSLAAKSAAAPPVPEAQTKKELVAEIIPDAAQPAAQTILETPVKATADVPEEAAEPAENGADFYRRRAVQEVSFLQIVEAAFEGIEREQLKIVPKPFDDLAVKKVLHSFLQINGDDANSSEYSQAEFQLLQETESWYSSLSLRDSRILTANLRRYLETSRPPLSSPALVALARFYRNSPCSEQIRSKFDLVITRLFTKEAGSRREMVFSRDDLIVLLSELYADWSSVSLYAIETNDATVSQTAHRFEEFIKEAENAKRFDELIAADFFNRLRLFKEEANENFYAPQITAMGIECNVRVGNRYIELLETEKGLGNVAGLEDKYGISQDNAISEATGKTLALLELLKQKTAPPPKFVEAKPVVVPPVREQPREAKKAETKKAEAEKVEAKKVEAEKTAAAPPSKKWVVALTLLLAAGIILAVYFGTKSSPPPIVKEAEAAPKMNLDNSMLKEYLSKADVQNDTLEGVVLPMWNHYTEEKKRDILKQMLSFGVEKGYKKVRLVNMDGKPVGIADGGNISIAD